MVLQVCYLWHCGAQTLCICTLPSGPPSELPWSPRSAISGIVVLKLCASVLYPLSLHHGYCSHCASVQEVCCVCSVFQGCSGSCSVEVL